MIKRINKSFRAKTTIVILIMLLFICLLSSLLTALGFYFASHFGLSIDNTVAASHLYMLVNLILIVSISGFALFWLFKKISRPIIAISECSKEVAKGKFDECKSLSAAVTKHDEVGELARNFNLMIRELSSMEYLRKDFMSNVSHELKTPLASISAFIDLLSNKNLSDEEFDEYAGIVKDEINRLDRLCTNMLKLSHLDNQAIVSLKRGRFLLDEQIRKCIVLLNELWGQKNLEMNIDLERIDISGDEELLHQVWMNIIENAVKYSYHDSPITVSCRKSNDGAIVKVNNLGERIHEDEKNRIFEKFYQIDRSHNDKGNGLGLAIVSRIVSLHDGTVSVESDEISGTTFKIVLPL